MENIQNYLITVSGIISGIIIAFLSSKLFNLKQEHSIRQIEINKLADKLTTYRRILYCVIKSHDFWVNYRDIEKFKVKYIGLDFERLHSQNEKDELNMKFSLEEKELSNTTIDLFMAMEAIYGIDENTITWIFERTKTFNYSLNDLYKYYLPSNQIWYYLEDRYERHTVGLINDQNINMLYKNNLREWVTQINSKYRGKDFDRHLLAEVSTDFHEIYLPKLIELTRQNSEGLTKQIGTLFINLVLIFLVGVIFPLFIQSMCLLDKWNILLTLSAVGIIIVSFINFLFDFYKFMLYEVR